MTTNPPAEGSRIPWHDLPTRIRSAVETLVGEVIGATTMAPTGFSPAFAGNVVTASGRRFFVKATGPVLNPDSPNIYRQERDIVRRLPPLSMIPRLIDSYDEGTDGWVVLVFESVDAWNPALPWQEDELRRVLKAIGYLHSALTPAPAGMPAAGESLRTRIRGWNLLVEQPLPGLDPWSARHLERLAALEEAAPGAAEGETLLHLDLRADNLLANDKRVYVVDWPEACVGAPFVDIVGMIPSIVMQGGPPAHEILAASPSASDARPEDVTAVLASITGYFTQRALLPPPPGLPSLRPFQAAQGAVARRWLAQRTGWT